MSKAQWLGSRSPANGFVRVWSQIMTSLAYLRSMFANNEAVSNGLKNFVRKLVTPAVENIGWEFKQGEDYLIGQLRKLLISAAGHSGHEGYVFTPLLLRHWSQSANFT